MKSSIILFLLCGPLLLSSQSHIQINIPTAEDETSYIWNTLQDIAFFEQNNYQVSLPKGPLIASLKEKAKKDKLDDSDYKALQSFIRDSVYSKDDYQQGYSRIKSELPLINTMITELALVDYKWNFKTFDVYEVNLTLYGPGGSYNPDEGSLLVYTTPQGLFKQYDNSANTIIHEIIHIGIEQAIVQNLDVPHALKERIVDTIVILHFKEYLPSYYIQDMGDYRLDAYLKERKDLSQLPEIVTQILKTN